MHKRTILAAMTFVIAGLALFGNTLVQANNLPEIKQQPWITQEVPVDQNKDLVSAFNRLPEVTLRSSLPEGTDLNAVEVNPCEEATCGIWIPGWYTAVLMGCYNLGSEERSTPETAQVLIVHNVGAESAFFPAAVCGPSYRLVLPYPNGDPTPLAQYTADLAGYAAKLMLVQDRTGQFGRNPSKVQGADNVVIGGYLMDNGGRFTFYFEKTVSK